jgi:hypothetical protein
LGAVPRIVQLGNVPKYDLFAIAPYGVQRLCYPP